MGIARRATACNHLVHDRLVLCRRQIVDLVLGNAQMVKGLMLDQVDLVDQNPVLDLAGISVKHDLAVALKAIDRLARVPARIGEGKVDGHLVMRERDHRLHAELDHLVKEPVVERKAFLVGLRIVAVGEDARPRDRGPKGVEPHIGKQLKVLRVGMVKIDTLALGEDAVLALECFLDKRRGDLAVVLLTDGDIVAKLVDIRHARSLAVDVPCALALVGGNGAAPQKALGKRAGNLMHGSPLPQARSGGHRGSCRS